jgi:hypothetical protein
MKSSRYVLGNHAFSTEIEAEDLKSYPKYDLSDLC